MKRTKTINVIFAPGAWGLDGATRRAAMMLLAVDEDNPDRIVSTDKKAVKAGGLMLALAGQPVKPTDDVDVEKDYQLVAM